MKRLNTIRKTTFHTVVFALLLCIAGVTNMHADVPGVIEGLFTVNGNGDQVYFSQGNLQYNATDNRWRFAVSQYDIIGASNESISQTNTGYIDLFGWGTSGYNHGAVCYHPWSASSLYTDYYAYGSETYNLYDQTGKADWGYNAIANGGNAEQFGWCTLKAEEWDYVFNTRSTNSGIRFAKAQVNSINGVLLLPDDWQTSYFSLNETNTYNASFSTNVINADQWWTLEQYGVVFLPSAGRRSGTSVFNIANGCYWSASCNSAMACFLSFTNNNLSSNGQVTRDCGLSVRLVLPKGVAIQVSASPASGGVVTGAGIYEEGSECTLTATPNEGYEFVGWMERVNNEWVEISFYSSYTFTVTDDRELQAWFRVDNLQVVNGALIGSFSVSATETVNFSRGNLQYIGSATTPYWKFADHQWDYFGTTTNQLSTNENVDRDLFAWGTSGYNHGAVCYQPWNFSRNPSDYHAYGIQNCNLYDQTGKADWGYNAIANGGNTEHFGWRTLTNDEWDYLFNTRNTSSGLRYAGGIVFGLCGVILFPDSWDSDFYTPNNANPVGPNIYSNLLGLNMWSELEQRGAVFLPATGGYVINNSSGLLDDYGFYWSASSYDSICAYCISFDPIGFNGVTPWSPYCGNAVRLVRSELGVSYSIEAVPSPFEGGVVTGAGAYEQGAQCTLIATPNEGYEFVGWMENSETVSSNMSYTFTVTGDRSIVATFIGSGSQVVDGALNGVFSVSSTETVNFSKGNLQFIGSVSPVYWKFADHQWDILGETTNQNSAEISVDRDLFGWGTSGYNHGAVCCMPYCVSSINSDYNANGLDESDLTGSSDWGYNAIVNGGNMENSGWRTPTHSEWNYLFNQRATTSGIRFANAQVNGVNGMILFPDTWNIAVYEPNNANQNGGGFSSNVLNAEQWVSLEQEGAVFLPAAGHRSETTVSNAGSSGYYWSSSYQNFRYAYYVYFVGTNSYTHFTNRSDGQSVRLIRSVQNASCNIQALPIPEEGGEVSGAGVYAVNEECTLVATPNEGYEFVGWLENDEVVSTDLEYTFTVTIGRVLVASFEQTASQPEGVVIKIKKGWNWISYLLETETPIDEALINLNPAEGDMIKGQDGNSTYNNGQWNGTLNTLVPGQGYIYLRQGEAVNFTYPK